MTNKKRALFTLLISVYALVGIFVFIFAFSNREKNNLFLGLVISISSIVHFLLYFLTEGYKKNLKCIFLVIGILGLTCGLVSIFVKELSFANVCLMWGILDIVRAILEIIVTVPDLKKEKLNFVEITLSLGDIVFGILLIVKLENCLKGHLIFFGIAYIISMLKNIIFLCIENQKGKKQINGKNLRS